MCGIVGFVGDNALLNVLEGLATLEYRGYDSAGVAYDHFGLKVLKREGRLINVSSNLDIKHKTIPRLAIGHTRWATHGAPNETNAHPHVVGDIAIVHNGIIENYAELIKKFKLPVASETDSEVIAHLIDQSDAENLLDKVRSTCKLLEGTYAIAVMSYNFPDEFVIARRGSPLVVGEAKGDWQGMIASSDLHGILEHTNEAFILHDNEYAVLTENSVKFYDQKSEINKNPIKIDWSVSNTKLGNFDTYMRKEIQEQPVAIMDTLMKNDWPAFQLWLNGIPYTEVLLTACGTSFNAAKIGSMFIEGNGNVLSRAKLASEIQFDGTQIREGTLVVAVSQSGETADTLSAIRYAKSKGAIILAITNVMGSSLSREADYTLYTAAGPEISVASTKAFTSQLVVLYTLCGVFNPNIYMDINLSLQDITGSIKSIFGQEEKIKTIASTIQGSVLFLGRGLNAPLADEGALKLKEISYLHAEGFPAGEIKHGPIALIESGTPVVVIATNTRTYDKTISNIREVQARGARVIAIASEGDERISELTDEVIYIPTKWGEAFDPITAVVPLQLLAYHVAKQLGTDIDKPRNLAKSVTVE